MVPVGGNRIGMLEADGAVCAIGAVGKARGVDMAGVDPTDRDRVAALFGIPFSLACEIVYMNDEAVDIRETPEARFKRVRCWVEKQIIKPVAQP